MLADDMACNARNPRPGRFLVVYIITNILSNPTLGICKKGLEIYLITITYDTTVSSSSLTPIETKTCLSFWLVPN